MPFIYIILGVKNNFYRSLITLEFGGFWYWTGSIRWNLVRSHPSWRKNNWSDTSSMSATSLVFSSRLSLPSTVPSTTNLHVLNVVRGWQYRNNFNVNHYHHSVSQHKSKEIPTEETHLMEPKFHAYWSKITTKTILLLVTKLNQTYQIKPSKQTKQNSIGDYLLACIPLLSAKICWLEDDEELDTVSLFYVVYI